MRSIEKLGITLLAVGPVFFQVGCGGNSQGETAKIINLAPVEVIEVAEATEYHVEERFVGVVEARRRSNLAFELAGTVESVRYDEGDTISAGKELAEIDTARLEAQEAEILATREQLNATLVLAETDFERSEKLVKSGGVSRQVRDQSKEALRTTEARLAQVEAQLQSVRVDLAKSVLKAPYEGTISRRLIDEGAVVSPNQPVFEFLENGNLEVRAALPADVTDRLSTGGTVDIHFGDSRILPFPIKRILPLREKTSQTIDVILGVPESLSELRDGDLVEVVHFKKVPADGFFLPRDALTESTRGLWACFVAVEDLEAGADAFRLDRRDVEVIEEYADFVFARGGIGEGDRVLSSGNQKTAPGQRVRIVKVVDEPGVEGVPEIVDRYE